jgi:hypothetical protein
MAIRFIECKTAYCVKSIQNNKLGQSTSKIQLKNFKFEEKIPSFSARLSVLLTFSKFLMVILFFVVVRQHIESKNIKKKSDRRKIEDIIFAMFSELV